MKKILPYLVVLFVLLNYTAASQNQFQVTSFIARHVATNFLKAANPEYISNPPQISQVIPIIEKRDTLLFEVMFATGEYVIVAGHASSHPILYYQGTTDGAPISQDYKSFSLAQLRYFEKMLCEQRYYFENGTRADSMWIYYFVPHLTYPVRKIGPLLKTQWNQDYGQNCTDCQNGYNKYMPYADGECSDCDPGNYPTGCSVTAFGQVMNYWKYPPIRIDREQIDWCNMPQYIYCNESDTSTDSEVEAVARLMKILGDELNVHYGYIVLNSDILYSILGLVYDINRCFGFLDPANALSDMKSKFGYYNGALVYRRFGHEDLWADVIRYELELGRPVIYWAVDGDSLEAHTFVCDGYDSINDLFHFNWGHGDAGSWCHIDIIREGASQWTLNEHIIVGLQPQTQVDFCDIALLLDVFYEAFYSISSNMPYLPYNIVPQTMASLTSASANSDSYWRTIPSGAITSYRAHNEIVLQDGFEAERGSDFTAEIVPCPNCEENTIHPIHPIFDSLWPTRDSSDILDNTAENAEQYGHMNTSTISLTDIFPNPTSGELTVMTDGMAQSIIIYNTSGYPVGGWDLLALTDGWLTIDVTTLPAGPYIITVSTASGNTAARFVKK